MPLYTAEELDFINNYDPLSGAVEEPPADPGFFSGRTLTQIGNIPMRVGNAIASDVVGLSKMLHPELQFGDLQEASKKLIPTMEVEAPKNFGAQAADVLFEHLAPEVVEWAIPYGAGAKALKYAGAAPLAAEMLAQGAASFLTSADQGAPQALASGAFSALGGGTSKWSRLQRLIPLGAMGGAEFGTQMMLGSTAGEAAIMAGADVLGNLLPGKVDFDFPATKPLNIPDVEPPAPLTTEVLALPWNREPSVIPAGYTAPENRNAFGDLLKEAESGIQRPREQFSFMDEMDSTSRVNPWNELDQSLLDYKPARNIPEPQQLLMEDYRYKRAASEFNEEPQYASSGIIDPTDTAPELDDFFRLKPQDRIIDPTLSPLADRAVVLEVPETLNRPLRDIPLEEAIPTPTEYLPPIQYRRNEAQLYGAFMPDVKKNRAKKVIDIESPATVTDETLSLLDYKPRVSLEDIGKPAQAQPSQVTKPVGDAPEMEWVKQKGFSQTGTYDVELGGKTIQVVHEALEEGGKREFRLSPLVPGYDSLPNSGYLGKTKDEARLALAQFQKSPAFNKGARTLDDILRDDYKLSPDSVEAQKIKRAYSIKEDADEIVRQSEEIELEYQKNPTAVIEEAEKAGFNAEDLDEMYINLAQHRAMNPKPVAVEEEAPKMKRTARKKASEGGFVVAQTLSALAGATVGGVGGYQEDGWEGAALGAAIGAAGALGVAKQLRKLKSQGTNRRQNEGGLVDLSQSDRPQQIKIEGPALRFKGDVLGAGKIGPAHKDFVGDAMARWIDDVDFDIDKLEYGFRLSDGRFVTRQEAEPIALAAGQVRPDYKQSGDLQTQDLIGTVEKPGMAMRKVHGGEAGAVSSEAVSSLAGAAGGALIGYAGSDGSIPATIGGALIGAGLGAIGIKALRDLQTHVGPTTKVPKTTLPPTATVKEKLAKFRRDTMVTPAGYAVGGRGGLFPNTLKEARYLLGLDVTPELRDAKLVAGGYVAELADKMQKVVDRTAHLKPSAAFVEASSRYIRGQLTDEATVHKLAGTITSDAWEKLPTTMKAAYPEKWIVQGGTTNTSGSGVKIYRTTNAAKATLLQGEKNKLASLAASDVDRAFMELPMAHRATVDEFQGLIHDAMPDGLLRNKLLGTTGQYQTRTFEAFTNPKWYPTEKQIDSEMGKIKALKEDSFLASVNALGTPGHGRVAVVDSAGNHHYIPATAKDDWDNLTTDTMLRRLVEEDIKSIKASKGMVGKISKSQDLDASIMGGRKELDESRRAFLGEHVNVRDEILATSNRLIPTAESAKMMTLMMDMKNASGLRKAYKSDIDYNRALQDIEFKLSKAVPGTAEFVTFTNLQQEIKAYTPMPSDDPRVGLFAGSWVSADALNQLKDYKSPFGILENSVGRSLAAFNNTVKMAKAPYNPITQIRNVFSVPAMLALGNVHANSLKTAFAAIKDTNHPLRADLIRNGVFSGNQVYGEFQYGLKQILDGELDSTIWKKMKGAHRNIMAAYAMPDDFVRVATFLSAQSRGAEKLGKPLNDEAVLAYARKFMERRTMNYSNVAPIVKTGRQLPFVNMYLSYGAEIARVMKNTAMDGVRGDLRAGATFTAIAAFPFVLQQTFESQLSDKDRKEWEKSKRLSADYSRTRFKLPTHKDKNGNFHYIDFTSLNVADNYQQMIRGVANGDWGAVAAVNPVAGWENTPLLSIAASQITGKDLHTHREFRGASDRVASFLQEISPPHIPGVGYEAKKIANIGVTNLKNGRTTTLKGTLIKHATGVDYTTINLNAQQKQAVAAAAGEIANEKAFLNDVKKSTRSPEEKDRAQAKFNQAVLAIRSDLEHRLRTE